MNYIFIICPFISLFICQIIKNAYDIIKNKKIDIKSFFESGSMPSSHAAFSSSVTFLIGYLEGVDSSIFALALVFTMITCYDAVSVRYESGMHAKILNEHFNLQMKERLGHKFLEVVVGILIGFTIATLINIYL